MTDQSGLSGTVRTDDGVQLALLHRQNDRIGGDDTAETLRQAVNLEERFRHGVAP